jgi:hypothetical protein
MRAKCAGIKMCVDHSYGDIFPNGLLIIWWLQSVLGCEPASCIIRSG